jgi:hypothetical protein
MQKPDDWSTGSWLLINFVGWLMLFLVARGTFALLARW